MQPERHGSLVVRRLAQLVAVVILAAAVWQTAWLLRDVVRYRESFTIWVQVQAKLPVYLLCVAGSVGLLRGKRGGYKAIYLAAAIPSIGWGIPWATAWITDEYPIQYGVSNALESFQAFRMGVASAAVFFTLLAILAVTHICERRCRPPSGIRWCQFRLCSLFVLMSVVALVISTPLSHWRLQRSAEAVLDAAYEARGQDDAKAIALFEEIRIRYPFTTAWDNAVVESGELYIARADYQEATARFQELLEPNAPIRLNWLDFLNDQLHSAHVGLATCFEERGDYEAALRYATLGRDEHPGSSWFGAPPGSEKRRALDQRIARLEKRLLEGQVAGR